MNLENLDDAKEKVNDIFEKLSFHKDDLNDLLHEIKSDKLYEAFVVAELIRELKEQEGFKFVLRKSRKLRFKASPGPINDDYPYIEVFKDGEHIGNLYTDIEFLALSAKYGRGVDAPEEASDKHELDILFCKLDCHTYPHPDEIYLGVECKNTTNASKQYLKSILGIRRELSYKKIENFETVFENWPASKITYIPPVCLQFYTQDETVPIKWQKAGEFFEIDFIQKRL